MVTDDRSGQVLGVAVAFLVLNTVTTGLRVFTRVKVLGKQFGSDDAAMIASFVLFLVYVTCQILGVEHGTGKKRRLMSDEDAQTALRFWFFCEIFYTMASCLLKTSIGLFLLRIAARRSHIWIVKAIMFFNVVFSIPYCLLVILQCRPVSFWWDLNPAHTGQCLSPRVMVINSYTVSALNSLADWTFGVLPIFMVRNLQMKKQTKVLVASILGFAALGSTATIIRTPFVSTMTHYKGEFLWKTTDVAIWTTVELGVGATAANTATLRPLLSRIRRHFHAGLPSSSGGSRPLPPTFTRSRRRVPLDPEALVTLEELRAGGADTGRTEVTIYGGNDDKELPPLPVGAVTWGKGGIVQSVEIRTERESRDGSCGRSEERLHGDTITEEVFRAMTPYERL